MLDSRFTGSADSSNTLMNGFDAIRLRKPDDVRAVVSPEGLVLLHVRRGVFFRANLVGAGIWEKLIKGVPVPEIAAEITQEFDGSPDVVAKDVDEFIKSLVNQGFLA